MNLQVRLKDWPQLLAPGGGFNLQLPSYFPPTTFPNNNLVTSNWRQLVPQTIAHGFDPFDLWNFTNNFSNPLAQLLPPINFHAPLALPMKVSVSDFQTPSDSDSDYEILINGRLYSPSPSQRKAKKPSKSHKKWFCNYCERRFNTQKILLLHLKEHHKNLLINKICDFCSKNVPKSEKEKEAITPWRTVAGAHNWKVDFENLKYAVESPKGKCCEQKIKRIIIEESLKVINAVMNSNYLERDLPDLVKDVSSFPLAKLKMDKFDNFKRK